MEFAGPQAKPWLVRLPAFRVGPRPERRTGRVHDEILAVLPEIVDGRGEFTMKDLMARLNSGNEERRRWALEKAMLRLTNAVPFDRLGLERLGPGRYRYPTTLDLLREHRPMAHLAGDLRRYVSMSSQNAEHPTRIGRETDELEPGVHSKTASPPA